jgi:4'-phosphopantetheinyl transferase
MLPKQLADEITAYQFDSDRKLSLLARRMLCQSLREKEQFELIKGYSRDTSNKPYIPGWINFSISHSGEIVLFAESDHSVGVDVEQINQMDYEELATFFHEDERAYILEQNVQNRFYEIWTKKEAVLKAIGIGIVNGLNYFSCINESVIVNDKEWYFYELHVGTTYKAYVCTDVRSERILLEICE